MNPALTHTAMNFLGAAVDEAFLLAPKILAPFRPKRAIDPDIYEEQVNFYFDQGFVAHPETFFCFPENPPDFRMAGEGPYLDGKYQEFQFISGYTPRNPMLREQYLGYKNNRTGYFLRWTHGDRKRKTVLCLHGYMLGDPGQAEKMFKVGRLYRMGLDVALFITPFHWKRAPKNASQRGIFLQPDDVVMTCECFGQAMHDLYATMQILARLGAGPVGILGASLGGYNAALFTGLTDIMAFTAMMVPAVNFSKPFGPDTAKLPFAPSEALSAKMQQMWTLHSPLNFTPCISTQNILIIASQGDKLCPYEHVKALCEKWAWPRHHFMTGGHWLVLHPRERGRAWYQFLTDMGFDGR
ncbi:MAG: YqiA/YcfP family alpha/beta fold hydrolase [Desulfobacterales bacterium]|nr:YqiA/YcfP family alpha/beta fold hydrolase [Desulfobacterales bacterium]